MGGEAATLGKRPEPHPLPNPRLLGRALSPRRLWGCTFTDGVSEEGSECGAGRGSPGLHPSAGEEAPAHKASGWVVRRPQWGSSQVSWELHQESSGCGAGAGGPQGRVLGPERESPALSRSAQPRPGQVGATGRSAWGWRACGPLGDGMALSRHTTLTQAAGPCACGWTGGPSCGTLQGTHIHPHPPTCCTRCFSEPVYTSPGCRLTHTHTMDTHLMPRLGPATGSQPL